MRVKKYVELSCSFCGGKILKEQKEFTRQNKKGRIKWYCNHTCSSRDNPVLAANAKKCRDNPSEAVDRLRRAYRPPRQKDEFSPFRHFLRKIRQRLDTLNKPRDFDISLEYLKSLWDTQKGKCPYTNLPMDFPNPSTRATPKQASIDRIDSSKGYIRGNVEFVCLAVNYAKNGFEKNQMLAFFSAVQEYVNKV